MKEDILNSSRLSFSKFQESDFDDLYEFLSDEDVCEYLPGEGVYSKTQIQKWLNFFINSYDIDKPNMIYAVREKGKDKVIGYAGFAFVVEFNKNEIMYAFNKKYWNKGYATESAEVMLDIAKAYNQRLIIALADVDNIASDKVLRKIGYEKKKVVQLWGCTLNYYEMNPHQKQV